MCKVSLLVPVSIAGELEVSFPLVGDEPGEEPVLGRGEKYPDVGNYSRSSLNV